jgi:membrane protease YdiL (CAAX protease family)
MFIEQGIKTENRFWKYLAGSALIILASAIGQIPFGVAVAAKALADGGEMPTSSEDVMGYLEPNLSLFLMLLSFAVAFPAIYLVVRYLHNQSFLSVTTARKKVDWGRIFFSFGLWAAITILITVVGYYTAPEDFVWNFKPVPFAILAVIAVLMVPLQTSTEEYVFRGYLMQGFGNLAKNRWFPLIMTSLIFGLMHIVNPEVEKMGYIIMVYYIGTGLFLGVITLMDDGMELALGFHAANNLIGALLITSDWTAFQTNSALKDVSLPGVGYDVMMPIFIIFPILLFIFSKKYKWKGWQQKLTGKIENKNEQTIKYNDNSGL